MTKSNQTIHKPVLLNEVIESLDLKKSDIVFDGTLGGGGYSFLICQKIGKDGILIGTDLDSTAISKTKERLKDFENKKYFFQKNYSEIKNILKELKISKVDKIVLDLGISSDQLLKNKRGISFQDGGELLDMNLSDKDKKITASEILNTYSEETLADLFYYYGGEKAARKIAKAIVQKRKEKEFKIVSDLTELIEEEIGHFYKHKKINPSTKVFQALRITVNDEISNLKKVLEDGFEVLEKDGLFAVVAFHSLEDRNVKRIFQNFQKEGLGEKVNKKVIKPSEEELSENKRARSAKLRVFKKLI
ncbi:ribosomal RNA small subunit methyltransferase H [Candidatus Campbellbacteria bacterium]|nr:MAG: ribosomal RNA small subunit methyltransferase H [Candidatus Campbellbacteria bacterium]